MIEVPVGYRYCFNTGCPRESTCMRHFAAEHVSPQTTVGRAVFPTALQADGSCKEFKEKRVIRAAWGFTKLFRDVKERHASLLRGKIKAYLGGNGTYYRYQHGERLLTPEQQQWIFDLFRKYGYTEGLEFEGYHEIWDW